MALLLRNPATQLPAVASLTFGFEVQWQTQLTQLTVSHPQKNLCLGAVAQAASAHRTNRNPKPNPHSKKPMKTRKNPFRTLTAASLLATILASAPALQAATFTWTGAGANTSWAPASGNWNPSPAVFDAL
jgi:hypothetical protein